MHISMHSFLQKNVMVTIVNFFILLYNVNCILYLIKLYIILGGKQ